MASPFSKPKSTPTSEEDQGFFAFAETCIIHAFGLTMDSYAQGGEHHKLILEFLSTNVAQWTPGTIFTRHMLGRIVDSVFVIDVIRDFVFKLSGNFNARLIGNQSVNPEVMASLNVLLAHSLSVKPKNKETLIPVSVANHLPASDDIKSILNNDPWLTALIMVNLCIPVVAGLTGKRSSGENVSAKIGG